jgi:fermentation-respiration switch protein FrsA (DUF1100 family)
MAQRAPERPQWPFWKTLKSRFLDLMGRAVRLGALEEHHMRRDVEIKAEGATLRGWMYVPDRASGAVPAIVMAHGFSAVKEMYLDRYAEVFSEARMAALVFDNRNFGASDGEPRQEIDPWQQVRDYRHAITWVGQQPGIDRDKIGVWGSSYSGGHALVLGAIDRRVKCVVSQVPLVSGSQNLKRLVRADMAAAMRAQFDTDREGRFRGAAPMMIPVVSEDPMGPAALPTPDSSKWFIETGKTRAPSWRNEVTLRTVEMLGEYEPASYIERISPTPLLMIIADGDHLAVADEAFGAYNRALEPKKLLVLKGGHFDAYVNDFEASSSAARDWCVAHLRK